MMILWILRAQISCESNHVIVVKLLNHLLHQLDPRPFAVTRFDIVQLPENISGWPPDYSRNLAQSPKGWTMADCARHRFAITTRHQRGAFHYAANWYVVDEA